MPPKTEEHIEAIEKHRKRFEEAKGIAIKNLEKKLKRPLFLSEVAKIELSTTFAELDVNVEQVELGLFASHQYESKIGNSLTGDLTIPAGTDLRTIKEVGTWTVPDEYALTTSLSIAPSRLHIPVLNTMVIIPMNEPVLKDQMIEKGIDFLADLMAIDGVQEVLEKYGVEIKPL